MNSPQPTRTAVDITPSRPISERRHLRRTRITCRAHIRPLNPGLSLIEEVRDVANISRDGLYFTTADPCYREHLHLYVACPYSNSAVDRLGEMARVVRVESLPGRRWGVAINFMRGTGFHQTSRHESVSDIKR